jgi:hypothetical protein
MGDDNKREINTEIMPKRDYERYTANTMSLGIVAFYERTSARFRHDLIKEGAVVEIEGGAVTDQALYDRIVAAYKRAIKLGYDLVSGIGWKWCYNK